MKKFYLFMVLLLTTIGLAFAQEPTFTPDGTANADASWYYIQFENSSMVLTASSTQTKAYMALPSSKDGEKEDMLWSFIGTKENFKLKNKAGLYLSFDNALGKFTKASSTDRTFNFYDDGNKAGFYQIKLNGGTAGRSMNQAGGRHIGMNLGQWNDGDANNYLRFVPEADVKGEFARPTLLPTFDPNATTWYQILFVGAGASSVTLQGGEGDKLVQATQNFGANNESQLWQLVGADENNVMLYNKNGLHVFLRGDSDFGAISNDEKEVFTFMDYTQNGAVDTYQLKLHSNPNHGLNAKYEVKSGNPVAHWDINNGGNAIRFFAVSTEAPVTTHTITKEVLGEGSFKILNQNTNEEITDLTSIADGTQIKIVAEPSNGYVLKQIEGTGVEHTAWNWDTGAGGANFNQSTGQPLTYEYFPSITANATIKLTFVPKKYQDVTPVNQTEFANADAITYKDGLDDAWNALNLPSSAEFNSEVSVDVVGVKDGWELATLTVEMNGETTDIKDTKKFIVKGDYLVRFTLQEKVAEETSEYRIFITPELNAGTVTIEGYTGEYGQGEEQGFKYITAQLVKGREYQLNIVANAGYELTAVRSVLGDDLMATKRAVAGEFGILATVEFEKKVVEATEYKIYITPDLKAGSVTIEGYTGEYGQGEDQGIPYISAQLVKGQEYKLNVVANEGYELKLISNVLGEDLTATKRAVAGEFGILATIQFEKKAGDASEYKILISPKKGVGTVTIDGYTGEYGEGTEFGLPYISAKLEKGKEYTLNVQASEGYELKEISTMTGGDITSSKRVVAGDNNVLAIVKFGEKTEENPGYKIFISPDKNAGSVTIEGYTGEYGEGTDMGLSYITAKLEKGKEYTLNIQASEGYELKQVTTGLGQDITATKRAVAGDGTDIFAVVQFEKKSSATVAYKFYVMPTANAGTIEIEGYTGKYETGEVAGIAYVSAQLERNKEYKLKVTPNEGFKLTNISTSMGQDITDSKTFTTGTSDAGATIRFEKVAVVETKTITIPTVDNGTITIDGVNSGDKVAVGTELTISVTPKKGYELESITVGGKDVTESKKFTVGEDNTIVVKFKKSSAIEGLEGVSYQVYPNPAVDFVQLRGFAPNAEVRLIALTGKTVLSTKTSFDGSATLNVSKLPRGLYLVRSGKLVVKLQVR